VRSAPGAAAAAAAAAFDFGALGISADRNFDEGGRYAKISIITR
jgi:hypothetical protein